MRGNVFQRGGVAPLGIDFSQLAMHGNPGGMRQQGFFQNFFGLHVAAIGQIDVGLGHGIHIARRVKLAGRIGHGGLAGHGG